MDNILFTAPSWCGPCRMLEGMFTDADRSQFRAVDPESDSELAQQYSIRSVPTLVDVSSGKKYVGAQPILEFLRAKN